jgi:RsiW-degrading membrane proteinase PrsW (M82 family)
MCCLGCRVCLSVVCCDLCYSSVVSYFSTTATGKCPFAVLFASFLITFMITLVNCIFQFLFVMQTYISLTEVGTKFYISFEFNLG